MKRENYFIENISCEKFSWRNFFKKLFLTKSLKWNFTLSFNIWTKSMTNWSLCKKKKFLQSQFKRKHTKSRWFTSYSPLLTLNANWSKKSKFHETASSSKDFQHNQNISSKQSTNISWHWTFPSCQTNKYQIATLSMTFFHFLKISQHQEKLSKKKVKIPAGQNQSTRIPDETSSPSNLPKVPSPFEIISRWTFHINFLLWDLETRTIDTEPGTCAWLIDWWNLCKVHI